MCAERIGQPASSPSAPSAADEDRFAAMLVQHAKDGDESAFEALVRINQDKVYRVALRLTGSPQDAQDVVQEAFLHAWQGLPRFRGDAGFSTWLMRIVINRCHNLNRGTRRTEPLREDHLPPVRPTEEVVVAAHQREATTSAITALPFDQRVVLVLHVFSGYTHAETARTLGVTENTVKVRVHRARRALTAQLQEWR